MNPSRPEQRRLPIERLLEIARAEGLSTEPSENERESSWLRSELKEREEEQGWLLETLDGAEVFWQAEREKVRVAHDRLLDHHRRLVSHLVEELESVSRAIPFWRTRQRRRVIELLDQLRKELG